MKIPHMPSNQRIDALRECVDFCTEEAAIIERILVAWQHVADRDARKMAWKIADKTVSEDER